MPAQPVQLVRFDPLTASEEEWEDHVTASQLIFQEYYPDAPALTIPEQHEHLQQRYQNPEIERVTLLARVDGNLAGMFHAEFLQPASPLYERYQQTGFMLLYVLPEYRRRGIATAFLEQVVEIAAQREILFLQTSISLDAGRAFAEYLGMQEAPDSEAHHDPIGAYPAQLFVIPVDELAAHLGL